MHLLSSGLSDRCEASSSLFSPQPSFLLPPSHFLPAPPTSFPPSPLPLQALPPPQPFHFPMSQVCGQKAVDSHFRLRFMTSLWPPPCGKFVRHWGTLSCQGKHCWVWGLVGRPQVPRPCAGGLPVMDAVSDPSTASRLQLGRAVSSRGQGTRSLWGPGGNTLQLQRGDPQGTPSLSHVCPCVTGGGWTCLRAPGICGPSRALSSLFTLYAVEPAPH